MRCAPHEIARAGSREPPPAEEEPAAEDEEGEGAKEPKPPKIVYPPYEEPGTPANRRARRPASQSARLSLESRRHCAQAPSAPSDAASGHAWLAYLAPTHFRRWCTGSADDVLIKSPNQFVYYVTNVLTVPWTRLPDVKPVTTPMLPPAVPATHRALSPILTPSPPVTIRLSARAHQWPAQSVG